MPYRKPPPGKTIKRNRGERQAGTTAAVKGIADEKRADHEAKTARLREQRLANEAAEPSEAVKKGKR